MNCVFLQSELKFRILPIVLQNQIKLNVWFNAHIKNMESEWRPNWME